MAIIKPQSFLKQGDDEVCPITTADQIILADGSRLEKNGKIVADDLSEEGASVFLSELKDYIDETLLNATW